MQIKTALWTALSCLVFCGCSVELPSPETKSPGVSSDFFSSDAADGNVDVDTGDPDVDADGVLDTLADEDADLVDAADAVVDVRQNCKVLRGLHPEYLSGLYEIDVDDLGPRPPVRVYCEMSIDNGGWTLVARSDDGDVDAGGGFGWSFVTGAVDNFDAPYSLGVGPLGLPFTELLVASRSNENTLVDAYHLQMQTDFLTACASAACPASPQYVLGQCPDVGLSEPSMLSRAGFTEEPDYFYFRDNDGDEGYGLFPNGFQLNGYDECQSGGMLDSRQGLIFVR